MAVLSKKEFMDKVNTILKDRTDDEALGFIEDCKDTISSDPEEWKTKYEDQVKANEELEKTWREKYRARFFESDDSNHNDNNENNKKTDPKNKTDEPDKDAEALEKAEKIRCDDLFTEVK